MSDFDFDDLDKAVKSALNNREHSAGVKSDKNPQKPAPAPVKPAAKPANIAQVKTPQKPRGRYLDMIAPHSDMRRKNLIEPKKSYTAPTPSLKPLPSASTPSPHPSPSVHTPAAPILAPERIVHEEIIEFGIIEDVRREETTRAELAAEADFVAQPIPFADEETPDANNFSLGGKSPFLAGTVIEKRPLGTTFSDNNAHGVKSTKNVYTSRSAVKPESLDTSPPLVVAPPRQKSGWPTVIAIFFIILLGAALGGVVYLLFLQ